MRCPTDDAWMNAALGDVTVNTRSAMLAHERTCERCRSAHQDQLQLLSDLKALPALHESEDAFVASVMARCAKADDSPPEAREPTRVLRFAPWVASALAAAAMLALAATRPFEDADPSLAPAAARGAARIESGGSPMKQEPLALAELERSDMESVTPRMSAPVRTGAPRERPRAGSSRASAWAETQRAAEFDDTDRRQARGGSRERGGAAAVASADVFLARGAILSPLAGAQLHGGDRLAVRVTNKAAQRRFFMAFAIDAKGEVHWVYPAYLDAHTNPEAPALSARQAARMLPETVELADVAEGTLRVVSMVSERRMTVREVEDRLASLPTGALPHVFPESMIREWRCTWQRR